MAGLEEEYDSADSETFENVVFKAAELLKVEWRTKNKGYKKRETETMKYFKNVKNLEELRKQYMILIKKYHPDNGGNEEVMKAVNIEYEKLFAELKAYASKPESKFFDQNVDAALREAIEKIIHLDGIAIEICGCWVWVSGDTYDVKEALKSAGFRWCRNKKMWSYHTGEYKKATKKEVSIEDIRSHYGSEKVKTQQTLKLV